jgi:hypothetical protein
VPLHIDDAWNLLSHTLFTSEFPDRHAAINITDRLEAKITEFNLEKKVNSTTHDNAANVTKAINSSDMFGESNPCYAHTQNLCVMKVLNNENVKPLLKKCTKIVAYFKQSSSAKYALKKEQKRLKKKRAYFNSIL